MITGSFDPVFCVERIVLIGASINLNSVSEKVLTNLIGRGFNIEHDKKTSTVYLEKNLV